MKETKLYLSHDYRSLYESSCGSLRTSIINALGEVLLLTDSESFILARKNSIKIKDVEFIGVSIKDKCIHFVIIDGDDVKYVRIYDKQKDKYYKMFNSDINNWITFIEKVKEEFNNAIE